MINDLNYQFVIKEWLYYCCAFLLNHLILLKIKLASLAYGNTLHFR